LSLSQSNDASNGDLGVDVCIVGAGIAGLAARRRLRQKGFSTCLFEKSRGAGGRMSTRRLNGQITDLGAQFTSAQNPDWAEMIAQAKDEVNAIHFGPESTHPRFVHRNGMSALARTLMLAESSDIFFGQKVISLREDGGRVEVMTEAGMKAQARILLLTAPVPQSVLLIKNSGLNLAPLALTPLDSLQYQSCLAVIATLEGRSGLPSPGIVKNPTQGIAGIYDQGLKGLRTSVQTCVVHASAETSLALWELPDEVAAERIWNEALDFLKSQFLTVRASQLGLHRWRYCEPKTVFGAPYFAHDRLVFAGDGFGQSSVNGAFSSGQAAAEFISTNL
jgi:renalase